MTETINPTQARLDAARIAHIRARKALAKVELDLGDRRRAHLVHPTALGAAHACLADASRELALATRANSSGQQASARFVVAQRRSVTTPLGIVGPGEPITPDDLPGGEGRLLELVEAGVLLDLTTTRS